MSFIDERFLEHRRRSTSLAGIAGGVLATCLWSYDYFVHHVWNWQLLSVALTIAGLKMILMLWYRMTD